MPVRLKSSFAEAYSVREELLYIYANDLDFVCYPDEKYPARLREVIFADCAIL
jgi:hypothetical protein